MKPNASVGSHDRHPDDKRNRQRAPRRTHAGPISFGHVLQNIRRDKRHDIDSSDLSGAAPAGNLMLHGSVFEQLAQDAHAAIVGNDTRCASNAQQQAQTQPRQVSPERAMQLIADVTREMNGAAGARELHLELEPAHLGPIVASIMVQRGKVSVRITAREAAAARRLDADSGELRNRLAGLGYTETHVDIAHDSELALTTS